MPILPINEGNIVGETNGEIVKSKLLLVEGKDETVFFRAMFRKIPELNEKINEIQIVEIGGVEKFKTELPALINRTGFSDNVEAIALIRDADRDYQSAFQSVCSLLALNNLPHPTNPETYIEDSNLKVGIYIMPGNENGGTMLEDLCLSSQSGNPIMSCVHSFFDCLEEIEIDMPRNLSKARTQVYLAAMPKIVHNLGLGAEKGYWDLNHDCMTGLQNFLGEL